MTKKLIEIFANEALLSEQEILILRSIAKDHTRIAAAEELNISVSSLDKKINVLKQKYDYVSSYMPELPKRDEIQQFTERKAIDYTTTKKQKA